ncbi:MAG: rhomboid family intramembrane serine protease [Bacteroidetes bacterium]|jgi:membrane associated rhomboid family serine protease|nr:rhomboid family intramembrane serine protease [Bacteroidota bacterium]
MRISYNAPVTLSFGLAAATIHLLDTILAGALTSAFFVVYPDFSFLNPLDYVRIWGHVLGHANWEHLLANFTFILLLGPILEEKYGSKLLLWLMVATALITGLLNVLFFTTALLGASGVVYLFIVLASITNIRQGEIPLTLVLVAALFLGKEVLGSFAADNVSQFAHILGGAVGGAFGLLMVGKKSAS